MPGIRIALAGAVPLLLLLAALALFGGPGDSDASSHWIDYDTNDNNLIDVKTLDQLNAIRHDLDGDGDPASGGTADYNTAFRDRVAVATGRMGCPATCIGYELMNDLDFDTTGNDNVADPPYDDWTPIGDATTPFSGEFKGNGHTIANLAIDAAATVTLVGLFGEASGAISGVGLPGADVTAMADEASVGALVGKLGATGTVTSSWAAGMVLSESTTTDVKSVGGLVGFSEGAVRASYAEVTASTTLDTMTDPPTMSVRAGGLVGNLEGAMGKVTASYATGTVSGGISTSSVTSHAGGLVGRADSDATITASYARGRVVDHNSDAARGGLVGTVDPGGTVTNSYWDTTTSGIADDSDTDSPEGKNSRELKSPTRYTGIYADWNVDVDSDTTTGDANGKDNPWDFGAAFQYPALKYGDQDIYRQGRVRPPTTPTGQAVELPPIIYNLNIRFDARRIALPEGHSASYRARLAGPPSGSSKISIRSDNPDVTPSPNELTFTAANWNQWQTVSIAVAGDPNRTDENATLAHHGPNRGYGSVLVSVTDTGDSRQAGDTLAPALTVITEPGARWGVTVAPTVPADLAANGEVRVSPAYNVPRTATGYSLGRNGVAQTIVGIAGPADVPASGLTVCLPAARALVDEAGERTLTLLRYAAADSGGASWQALSGAEHNAAARSVCAPGVTGFGPFASAYVLPQ